MSLSLQILLTGLAAGSVYGLLAVGHTLVYQLTGIVHFALGDLVGLGVFTALLVTAGRGPVTQASATSWRFALALVVGVAVTAAVSSGSYNAFIKPYLARGSVVGWVAASVAIAFAIEALLRVLFIRPAYVFPDPIPFHRVGNDGIVTVGFRHGDTPNDDATADVAAQADGKIVVVGITVGVDKKFAVVRLNPNGTLDQSFHGGAVVTDFPNDAAAAGVAINDNNHKIAVGGVEITSGPTIEVDAALAARYLGS